MRKVLILLALAVATATTASAQQEQRKGFLSRRQNEVGWSQAERDSLTARKGYLPSRIGLGVNVGSALDYGTMSLNVIVDDFDGRVTAHGGVRWNPWTFNQGTEQQFQSRKFAAYIGARYWWNEVLRGWWAGGKMQLMEYNRGGVQSQKTEEGFKAGFGAWGGYMWNLGKNFYLDAGLGFWGGYKGYTVYSCPECGRELESGSKAFILPDEWLINFVWMF